MGMLYVRANEFIPKTRNNIQRDCWNQGHKVIPDKKKCRQKNRAIRNYSDSPFKFREVLSKLFSRTSYRISSILIPLFK